MQAVLLVFLGGGIGSIVRFLISKNLNTEFTYGTLIVNILGCFLIGMLTALYQKNYISQELIFFTTVGFCGGLTTFSTFALELLQYINSQDYKTLIIYVLLSMVLGVIAAFLGFKIIK